MCNHCSEDNEAECNYTPKKRHKVPTDHGNPRERPVQPYGAKTASFLVSDSSQQPAGAQSHQGQGQGPITAADSGMIAGPSGSHVFESELRTEPQIRQYMPPHTPPVRDGSTPMNGEDGEGGYQMVGPDGQFTWVWMPVQF